MMVHFSTESTHTQTSNQNTKKKLPKNVRVHLLGSTRISNPRRNLSKHNLYLRPRNEPKNNSREPKNNPRKIRHSDFEKEEGKHQTRPGPDLPSHEHQANNPTIKPIILLFEETEGQLRTEKTGSPKTGEIQTAKKGKGN